MTHRQFWKGKLQPQPQCKVNYAMKLDLIWKEGTIWINIKIVYINDLNDPMVGPAMKCREHDIKIYKQEAHHWQVTSLCVLIYFVWL